ncbi:ESPR-type extended signal peptide-containing protein [uncultured Megasphaera sp.]|uniref:ESPR-type extended signal peptide-containing protein n=1 Tax=uncultured Megasphaera sp. TaxID=165188 RepID=UPI0025F3BC02|nr:ESPR-type extended signal peptide-containing protein [uncultured Megasphaera sp.]
MNKIFKVIYNKTKHCYVVVSELAKSHCKTAGSHTARSKTALTAAVLLALGAFSFEGMPVAQAEEAINVTNDYIGINTTVYDENGKKENPSLSKRDSKNSNYGGVWSENPGAITVGVYAGAGQQTVTIGNNNRTQSVGSVYIGEHKDYLKPGNQPKPAYYVTSVGFNADAAGYGSIAIGSNAQATNSDTNRGLRVYQKSDENGNGYGYLENNPTLKGASVAVGYSANAADGNVAIGAYSQALMDDKAKKSLKKKSVYTDEEASSYVSVGGTVTTKDTSGNSTTSTIRRRISNVADGADATDVATVGQLQALSKELGGYKEGFGIEITTDSTDKTKNKISLKRNLGRDANTKDKAVLKADEDKSALVIGGRVNQGDATGGQTTEKDYGALGQDSVTVGGADNTASGDAAVVVGGLSNTSSAQYSTVVGGSANDAIGNESSVFGGFNNDATGLYATISGGSYNRTYGEAASVFGGSMNNAVGSTSSVFGGSINTANGIWSSVVGGSHNTTLGLSSTAVGGENAIVDGKNSVGIAGGSTKADNALAAGNEATVTVNNGTAIGYQATANKEGTVAFGHDKDDVYYTSTWPQKATEKDGKYYDADNKEITEAQYEALRNADTTFNDYSQKPTVTENKYGSAAYNRLVKVADGIDDHDVVVMEQLDKAKTELTKDLSVNAGWGINVADVTTKNNDGTETTTKNVISLNRNLGTNYGNPWKGEGKVTFEAGGENSLILGGAASILFHNEADDVKAGAYGKDSVLVGGFNNLIDTVVNDATQTGEYAVIVGGDTNEVTGQKSVSVGGYKNTVTGSQSVINGGASNIASGAVSSVFGGQQNTASGLYASVFGGDQNEASEEWSSAIGGITNTASGIHAVTLGGENNVAKGQKATTVGGTQNMAIGEWSLAAGGAENTSYGDAAYTAGGTHNMAYGNDSVALGGLKSNVNAKASTGIAGGSTGEKAITALAAGYQSVVTDSGVEWHTTTQADLDAIKQGLPWSGFTYTEDHDPYTNYVLDKISTAVGYQSTADAPGVIAFGHDKGDVASVAKKWKQKATMEVGDDYSAKFYDANHNEISSEEYYKLANADGTWNDYTQAPIGTEEKTYQSAYYNRLVKAADGIDAHDAVVMEQLKPYTKSDASNIGSNLKTYTVGDDGETITEAEASADVKNTNENAWGAALGTGKVADPKATGEKSAEKNGSQQLVTGGTVFNETRISAKDEKGQAKTYNYLDVNDSAGKNLEALDSALKTVSTTAGAHTALTVEGNTPAGTQDEKTKQDVYAGKNILLHESTDATTGKVTYDLKLSNDIMIGNKGKDGVSIIGPQGEAGKDVTDGKVGISGKDGKDAVSISGKDGVGHIGLTGPAGTNGMNGADGQPGTSIDITVKNGYDGTAGTDGKDGVKGEKGVDGTSLTRIVYKDATGEHQIATMEDGLKFKGDDTTVISKKLNNTLDIIGGAKGDLTDGNIGVNSTDKGQLKVQLAKDLTSITSISNQTTTKVDGKDVTNGAKITLGTNGTTISGGDVNVSNNKVTGLKDGTEDSDAVTVKQLNTVKDNTNKGLDGKANVDASNIGNNIKVYKTDASGKVQLDGKQQPIEDQDATASAQNGSKDAWGKALGAAPFTAGTATTVTNASTSDQLVTGSTLYDYDKPTGTLNYVSANNTTGQNLSALDAQVKANAVTLNDKTHNIKYYSVNDTKLPTMPEIGSNADNTGATGMGSIAAGFNTHADGIASTVAGSYSGVINSKTAGRDLRGATALSYGTLNINQNTDATIEHSGVANSIIGQVNMTKNSNAAIIYGAGNIITDSYRPIDKTKAAAILGSVNDPAKLGETMKDAVKDSGGQVMVMGGGNSVDKAYMTQVTGVGNKVSGNDSTYAEGTSTQYNFVDGFQNELTNGMHDYIIGSKNKVSGDSVDKNQSNIIFGDNHKLTNQKNNVIIGSSDTADDETAVSNVVIIGHNAKVSAEGGVAIGSGSQATVAGNTVAGYDAKTGQASKETNATWKATNGAVSIGTADGKVTRQINGLAAGTNDTDAVNVAQLKSLQSGLTEDLTGKGLKFVANSGTEYTAKLGSTVTILGTKKKDGHEYTADNLTTEIDGSGNITILMDKDMSVEKLAVNGKDGKDGQPGSIGIKGQDGKAGISINGKDGISIKGKDGKDGVTMKAVDGTDGTEGHIGLTGPAGTNGMNGADGQPGTSIDITVKNGYDGTAGTDGKDGVKGEKGVDGTSLTRIVYKDATGEHQIATMEDGLKFKGDDTTVISKKLNNTLDIIGGAKGDLTDGNIGVNSTDKGQLKVQLAKDLKGITSISNQKTEGDKTTGAKITLGSDGSVDVNGGKITNVDSGADASGNYTTKTNAANIGDVQKIVKDAVDSASDTTNKALAGKANIDASNIGANLKDANGKAASTEAQKTNAEKWGSAIGTGKIEANDGRMVTGKTVYDEVRPTADGSYVKKDKTTGENLSALDTKIGSLDNDGNYIKKNDSISKNLSTLDAQVKNNADAITQINTSISTLDQNAVKYDNSSKSKITLGGEGGTTITKVKDGSVAEDSTEAVNGRQLWSVDQKVDANTTNITKNADDITSLKNLSNITDDGRTVIKNLSKDAVQVKAGDRINVKEATDEKTGNKTYTISANNNGTVAKGDGNLISGDTLYKEVHVDQDGSYIRSGNTVGQNLSALDSGLKTTSDLIHTNTKGDTIQIGGNSTATKIDVSGKDKDGNTTGRVITGIVTDGKDLTSAANVSYVKGITSANTQQIYRDMNNAYSRLDTNINRAAAGSNALAALHPLDFDPADKASFAVGYGHYHNANAAAIGAFYQPNANTMVNMGISLGNGDPGFNAGVSFKLGKGSAYNGVSKAEMAQTIHDQAEEISAIKANDAAKDKRIDALEKENQEMKKQIQEILSRLNG